MFGNKKLKQQQDAENFAKHLKEVEEKENAKKNSELVAEIDVIYTALKVKYKEATLSDAIALYNSRNTYNTMRDYVNLMCKVHDVYVF